MKRDLSTLTDKELLQAVHRGEQEACTKLVKRYEGRVASTVKGMLGNTAEAEDIGQETFVRLFNSLESFREESKLETYLVRIAINLSINELRKRKRRYRFFSSFQEDSFEEGANLSSVSEFRYEAVESREAVQKAIASLKPKLRAVVVLRLIDGYSTGETAVILKIPQGTVLSRLARAQIRLKELLCPYVTDEKNRD